MIDLRDIKANFGSFQLDVPEFQVGSGERVVLFGPNGAGKTSLLKLIVAGPLPVAYLPQRPWAFRGSARRSLHLGLDPDRGAIAEQLAKDFRVGDLLDRESRSLSGGERQRLALARVLARPEAVVLLDEPLAAIDAGGQVELAAQIVAALGDRTAVIVTHSRDDAVVLGDEVAVMLRGSIRQRGSVSSVFALPADEEVAAIVGVGNVLGGTVVSAGDGVSAIDHGGVTIWGLGDLVPGSPAVALFGGETVTVLASDSPGFGSARNHWTGVVSEIRQVGRLVELVVATPAPIVALLTPGSLDAMSISVGSEVGLSTKATAVRVVAR